MVKCFCTYGESEYLHCEIKHQTGLDLTETDNGYLKSEFEEIYDVYSNIMLAKSQIRPRSSYDLNFCQHKNCWSVETCSDKTYNANIYSTVSIEDVHGHIYYVDDSRKINSGVNNILAKPYIRPRYSYDLNFCQHKTCWSVKTCSVKKYNANTHPITPIEHNQAHIDFEDSSIMDKEVNGILANLNIRPRCSYDLDICQHKTCWCVRNCSVKNNNASVYPTNRLETIYECSEMDSQSIDSESSTSDSNNSAHNDEHESEDRISDNMPGNNDDEGSKDDSNGKSYDTDSSEDDSDDDETDESDSSGDDESEDESEEDETSESDSKTQPQTQNQCKTDIPGYNYIKCMYTNADSIVNKIDVMKVRVLEENPDIFAITETHCQSMVNSQNYCADESLHIPGYTLYRKDNPKEKRGGILVYVVNTIAVMEDKLINNMSSDFKESLWLVLEINKEKIIFGTIYRKGTKSTAANDTICRDLITKASQRYENVLICGDFNHPEINWLDSTVTSGPYSPAMRFFDCINDSFLIQHVDKPTRARGSDKPSLLDLILTEVTQTQVQPTLHIDAPFGNSDHSLMTWKYLISTCKDNNDKESQNEPTRNFNKGDYATMNSMLQEVNWDSLFKDQDLNGCVDAFYKKMEEITEKCIPLQRHFKPSYRPPWMTKRARKAIRKKKCAWQRYQMSATYNKYCQYVKQRNITSKKLKKAKRDFEKQLAKGCKKNPKSLFRYANFKNKVKHNVIRIKDEHGRIKVSNEDNANELNAFFESVFTDEDDANDINLDGGSCEKLLYKGKISREKLSSIVFDKDSIIEELNNIDPFKANKKDCIHPRILKEVRDNIVDPLSIIFNMSMQTGEVPDRWKLGTVTPLHKGGDKHQCKNYRPITLTSLLCRIMERIMKRSILSHLTDNDILIDNQHGFVQKRSCLSNLLLNIEALTTIYDRGDPVDELFLDLQKAFDSVPHQRLLFKLKKIGIEGDLLKWITSFLTGRQQRVAINGAYSKWCNVRSGVPQGSVLGPILFIIYINDLPEGIKSCCSIFADDTKVFRSIRCLEDADALQQDLIAMEDWTSMWKLRFNPMKCHVLHIGKKNPRYLYHLNGHLLAEVTSEKDLGVMVNQDLKCEVNTQLQAQKANKMLGIIRRTFNYLNKDSFLMLYKTYVRPHLEYGQQALHPYLAKDTEWLEKVQRRATKLVQGLKDLPYEQRLKELGLYSLNYRRTRADMLTVYKLIHGYIDIKMENILQLDKHSDTRGHNFKLVVPKNCNTDIRRNAFSYRVAVPWNKLNVNIVDSLNPQEFKRNYDKYMPK